MKKKIGQNFYNENKIRDKDMESMFKDLDKIYELTNKIDVSSKAKNISEKFDENLNIIKNKEININNIDMNDNKELKEELINDLNNKINITTIETKSKQLQKKNKNNQNSENNDNISQECLELNYDNPNIDIDIGNYTNNNKNEISEKNKNKNKKQKNAKLYQYIEEKRKLEIKLLGQQAENNTNEEDNLNDNEIAELKLIKSEEDKEKEKKDESKALVIRKKSLIEQHKERMKLMRRDPKAKQMALDIGMKAAKAAFIAGKKEEEIIKIVQDAITKGLANYKPNVSLKEGTENAYKIIEEWEAVDNMKKHVFSCEFEINEYPVIIRNKLTKKDFLKQMGENEDVDTSYLLSPLNSMRFLPWRTRRLQS